MKKAVAVFACFMLILLTGCFNREVENYNYLYKGENASWTAEYAVNGTGIWTKTNGKLHYDNDIEKVFTITYKGNISELANVRHLEIAYETTAGGGRQTEDYDSSNPISEKTFKFRSRSQGVAVGRKDQTIKVTITLDNDVQSLELKNLE